MERNGQIVPIDASATPQSIKFHDKSFWKFDKLYNLFKHNSGNTIETVNEKVLPKIDMMRSNPGTKIETPTTSDAIKTLEMTSEYVPNLDFSQPSSSIFTGCIVSGYFVRGFKAINHIVTRLRRVLGKDSDISSSTLFPNIKYPNTAIKRYVKVVIIYDTFTILG